MQNNVQNNVQNNPNGQSNHASAPSMAACMYSQHLYQEHGSAGYGSQSCPWSALLPIAPENLASPEAG